MEEISIAQSVADKIPYSLLKEVLIKPLEPIMVQREFEVPVPAGVTEIEDGIEATEYDEVKKEIREVESAFAKGIVIGLPPQINNQEWPYAIGDTIVYNKRMSVEFDLLKDSRLVKTYDIVAIEK